MVRMSYFAINKSILSPSIPEGSSFVLKDFRGFTVFEVKENGDVYRKGRDVKMQ